MKNIIIDCDTGVDDAFALVYCLANPSLNVAAISCVCGNVSVDLVAKNTQFVANWLNSKVPVYSGATKPLVIDFQRGAVMGPTGLGSVSATGIPDNYPDAVEGIKKILEDNPDKTTILAIGPLTNIAQLFDKYPTLTKKVERLFILGGSINGIGNMNRVGEFNFYIDPDAADYVLALDIPKTLIPLERCHETAIPIEEFKKLSGKSYFLTLWQILLDYQSAQSAEGHSDIIAYDALAAYVMSNPNSYKTIQVDAVVETTGKYTRGMLVPELRDYKQKNYNLDLVIQVNKDLFIQDFFNILQNYTK